MVSLVGSWEFGVWSLESRKRDGAETPFAELGVGSQEVGGCR